MLKTLEEEAIGTISRMPDDAGIDDIMYELYVISKVREGERSADAGELLSLDEVVEHIKTW